VCMCVSSVLFTHTHLCKYHIKVDESISIYRNSNKHYYFALKKKKNEIGEYIKYILK